MTNLCPKCNTKWEWYFEDEGEVSVFECPKCGRRVLENGKILEEGEYGKERTDRDNNRIDR